MADVFLSYSREDRAAIEPLAEQIVAAGYSVWWDKQLTGGKRYLEETEAELNAAKVVLVAWSKTSIASHWVADEAGAGRDSGRLLPISLDSSMPPLGFRQFQVIDCSKWRRDDGVALRQLVSALGKLTAPSGEANAAAKKKPGATPLFKQPLVLGGIALAAVALVAVVAMTMMGSKPTATMQNNRTAFFGFTATSSDPLVTEIATNATQETLTALGAAQVETAAPGDTQGVKLEDQLARAEKLGARYALGGSVAASGDKLTVTIRLDDTKLRATLWQKTLTGGAAQREALPVQAAAKASQLLQCMMVVRPDMEREDAASLGLVARACEPASGFDPGGLAPWRDAVRVAPKSAYAQYMSGSSWFYESATVSAADRTAMLAQARAAYLRAKALDPASSAVRASLASYDIASDRPLADIIKELNAALSVGAEQSNRRSNANASAVRAAMLSLVGSGTEAARLSRADAAADPLNVTLVIGYSGALVASGQKLEARRVLDLAHRRMADPTNWVRYAIFETFDLGGDLAPLLETVPLGVSPETVACVQDAFRAAPSRNATLRKAAAGRVVGCLRAGNLQPGIAMVAIIGLGDIDTAFVLLDRLLDRSNPLPFNQTGSMLFAPFSAPLRADPRFLPLVKREGIYQYWLDTKTQPDVCETPEERDIEVCVALRKDQGGK